jgi:hypothetical protein
MNVYDVINYVVLTEETLVLSIEVHHWAQKDTNIKVNESFWIVFFIYPVCLLVCLFI